MTSAPPVLPFMQQFVLKDVGNNTWQTVEKPTRIGNPLPVAYGGYAIGVACKAACLSVPKGYQLYSMLGNYLGPATLDVLIAKVQIIRQTRTFATCQVQVGQTQENGEFRACMIVTADFQAKEKKALLEYSRTPLNEYPNWKACLVSQDLNKKLLDDNKVSKELLDAYNKGFEVFLNLFEGRTVPTSVFAQNLGGMAPKLPHTQDSIPLPKRTAADWFRAKETLPAPIDHITNLAFFLDGAIAFQPLSYSHMWFEDVSACASLDFAFRVFQNMDEIDVNKWHLREMCTTVGGNGRSYGESWVWDEQGRAVACCTQQCILRPKVEKKGKL